MFENLDDPKPPQPRQLLVECVMAEGARRRRRRAIAVASVAATFLVVTSGVSLAQMGSSGPKDLTVTNDPEQQEPTDRTEGNGDDIGTAPNGTATTVTADPNAGDDDEGAATAPPGATTFAAITADQKVVLGDATTGAVIRELVPAPTDGSQITGGVALSPDGKDVYFVLTEQDQDGEYQYSVMRVSASGGTPSRISRGTRPAISPDGTMLAYVRGSTQIVLREVDTGHEETARGLPEGYRVQDLGFVMTDTPGDGPSLLYTAAAGEGAPAQLYRLDRWTVAAPSSLADATAVGPPSGQDDPSVEEGTGWSAPDVRADGKVSVVEQCCALEADSFNGGASVAFVDVMTGERLSAAPLSTAGSATVLDAPYDQSGQTQLVLSVEDDSTYVLQRRNSDGSLEMLDQAPGYLAVDW
jgi:hypothetical protein